MQILHTLVYKKSVAVNLKFLNNSIVFATIVASKLEVQEKCNEPK